MLSIQVSQKVNKPVDALSQPTPTTIEPRRIIGHEEIPYNIPASQSADKLERIEEGVYSLNTSLFHLPNESSYVEDSGLLLSILTPPVGLSSKYPPGLLYKLSEPIGTHYPPPEPVPESTWIALAIILSVVILVWRKHWF